MKRMLGPLIKMSLLNNEPEVRGENKAHKIPAQYSGVEGRYLPTAIQNERDRVVHATHRVLTQECAHTETHT